MLVKITDKCSMGCNHCMSDCTPSGQHMSFEVLKDVVKFRNIYGGPIMLLSGGEPTEHPNFKDFLKYTLLNTSSDSKIIVTTNGLWLTENVSYIKEINEKYSYKCEFQVVVDDRYYPIHVDESSEVFKLSNVHLCRDVMNIYPQGRALKNNLPFRAKASKCFNLRAMVKQLKGRSLIDVFSMMNVRGFFCTPNIDINGSIKLGESSLCPVCSSIYESEENILTAIEKFQCHSCDFINNNLPPEYKKFVE